MRQELADLKMPTDTHNTGSRLGNGDLLQVFPLGARIPTPNGPNAAVDL
jgi:hypothetical protein